MNNFTFYSPTLFAFGQGEASRVGALVRQFGGSKVLLIGDAIETMFIGQGANYNVGAALSLVLMVLILLCMAMTSFADKDDEEGGRVL